MKIRNVVGFIALALVVLTSVSVYAAGTTIDCPTCKNDSGVKHVPLPTGTQCSTGAFDYDNVPFLTDATTGGMIANPALGTHTGYCNLTAAGGVNENVANYRAVFAVCDCITATPSLGSRFDAGDMVGVRMTILVDGVAGDRGVYWADNGVRARLDDGTTLIPNTTTISMDTHTSKNNVCNDTMYGASFGGVRYYLNAAATNVATITTPKCSPAANERPIVLQTYPLNATELTGASAQGYTVTAADENQDRSYWGIDIPPMYVASSASAYEGKKIQVKVELLDAAGNTICAACTPICECTIDIAIIGCDSGTNCLTFSYVVTQLEESAGWATGIAVANLQKDVTDPSVTFTLTDSTGKSFTATNSMSKTVEAWMLDDILDSWTWTPAGAPAPGAATLVINGNFWMDGYQFMTDGQFGAGTLPRMGCFD